MEKKSENGNSLKIGILLMSLSALAFSLLNTCIKESGDLPLMQKCFFRNVVAFIAAIIVMKRKGTPVKCDKKYFPYVLGRALFGAMGMFCNFYSTYRLPLGDSACISKTAAFLTVFFCFVFLKETFTKVHVAIMAAVILGSVIVAGPSFGTGNVFPYFVSFMGAVFMGLAYTAIRKVKDYVPSEYIVFVFSFVTLAITTPFFIINFEPMNKSQLIWLISAGVFAAVGQFCITGAYVYAKASQVSVYSYLQIPFQALIGLFLLKEVPKYNSLIGYAIIIGMGVVLYIYEKELSKKKELSL